MILLLFAEVDGNNVGAAWSRQFENAASGGYGFIDPAVPELAVAVKNDYRNQGLGTALMKALYSELKAKGFKSLLLNVDKRNRAVNFYKKLGFTIFKDRDSDYLMLIHL